MHVDVRLHLTVCEALAPSEGIVAFLGEALHIVGSGLRIAGSALKFLHLGIRPPIDFPIAVFLVLFVIAFFRESGTSFFDFRAHSRCFQRLGRYRALHRLFRKPSTLDNNCIQLELVEPNVAATSERQRVGRLLVLVHE